MIGNLNTTCYRTGDIHDRKIIKDGKVVYRATEATNNLGVYVKGNKLYDNGRLVAVSAQEHPQIRQCEHLMFGEVRLDTDGVCINITLENYNKLYNREEVPGYKYFDPYDVYNIVANPSISPIIEYTRSENGLVFIYNDSNEPINWPYNTYVIYNNVIGLDIEDIEEDPVETVTQYNPPQLVLRYFNPRIEYNTSIKVPVAIDNYTVDYLYKNLVTGPYTIEVTVGDATITKTVYAGESIIETPKFTTIGETWFSIRIIDSNGVSSPVQYLDVYVEDPAYEENIWELTDADLSSLAANDDIVLYYDDNYERDGYTVVADPSVPGTSAYQTFLEKAYLNKAGFTALFEKVINTINPDNNKNYNGVKLPKHRYCICDYANKSDVANTIDLGNDNINYYLVEIEATTVNGVITTNKIISRVSRTLDQVKTDYDEIHRYRWYVDNYDTIGGPEELFGGTRDEVTDEVSGGHVDDIIYWSAGYPRITYFAQLDYSKPQVTQLISKYNREFHVYTKSDIDVVTIDSSEGIYPTDIKAVDPVSGSNKFLPSGKYYFRTTNSPTYGDHIVFPSNFILDLGGSILKAIIRYDYDNSATTSILLSCCTNTHIRNGVLSGGLKDCDWRRAICQTGMQNPFEQVNLFKVEGCRFCSFTNLDICEYIGFGSDVTYDKSSYGAITGGYMGSNISFNGRYNNKTLNSQGKIIDSPANRDMFVMANTTIPYDTVNYNNNEVLDTTIGYIPIANRPGRNYLFIGWSINQIYDKAKRKEVFFYFYNDNNAVVKIVKSKLSWLVRIPSDATKFRITGYKLRDASWNFLAISQVRGTVGMVYKNLKIYNTRSCIFNGNQRQALHDDIEFKNIAIRAMLYRGENDMEGCWRPITAHLVDIEDTGPLGKYLTFNNFRVVKDENYDAVNRSIVVQRGEHINITNNTNVYIGIWWGTESALVKNNTTISTGTESSCIEARRGKTSLSFHPFVLYENNSCDAQLPRYWGNISFKSTLDTESVDVSAYDDTREWKVALRGMTMNKPAKRTVTDNLSRQYMNIQNSKNGDEYID